MKKMKVIVLTVLCLFTLPSFASGRDNYQKAWEAFNRNDRAEARKYFETATKKEAASKAEAFLSLALLDWNESNATGAFANFQKFYETVENPYPYLYAMFSLLSVSGKELPDEQRDFYEKVASDPKMNGTLKAILCQRLGNCYFDRNDKEKAMEWFAKTDAIDQWQVLGSFNNISGSGFDKDWGAVSKAKSGEVFKNKVDADIRWYAPAGNRWDRWFSFDYYFSLDNIVVYAQSFVNSPIEQEVYLRTGTSGSLKIWVNDALVAAVPEERNCDLDIYSCKVKLNAGNNRILVQIGQSEIDRANFMLRITDENANPIEGITKSSVYADYKKSENQPTNHLLPFFAEQYFENKIKEEPDNLLNYIALGETYLRNDKSYEGTLVLKKAERLAPKSSFLSYRLSEAYLRANNQTDYSREIENIKQIDPDSYISLNNLWEEAMDSEKYSEAENLFNKIKKLYGENQVTNAMDFRLADAQKRTDDLIKTAQKLYKKYSYNYEYMILNYVIEDKVNKNAESATAVIEGYAGKYFDAKVVGLLADRYFNLGKTEEGLAALNQRIDYLPYATGYRQNYASTLQQMQKYTEALEVMEKVKEQAPYMASIYNMEGYIYKELKDNQKAKESFSKAIYYDPASYDSRTQLRLLDNKKEVFDLFPKNDLDAMIAKAPKQADYPEENSVIVLYDNQLVFYPEGAQERRTEVAIKILNQSGIEAWKQYGISAGNNEKLLLDKYEVIKANGQKIKAETDNQGTVVFTNLEVGDVLHLDYRLQNFYSGALSKHFFDYSLMQYNMPVIYNRYAILVPKDKKFEYTVRNGNIEPRVSDIENMKLYQWTSANQPAIKDEPLMSPTVDIAPVLIFSSIPDWNFVGEWYKDLTTNKISAHSDYVFKETFNEILKGKENASPMEKAELFYNYILKNITYSEVSFMQSNFIPQKASRTITTRLGDCKDVSTLFVALCREAGMDANLVLLHSRENGRNSLALPANNFNHCIAQLNVDDKIYYLELTNNKLPFGAVPESDLQSDILPIPYKNETVSNKLLLPDMPFRKPNAIIRNTRISLDENNMKFECSSARTGELASFSRNKYENMGAEDRLKDMNQTIAEDWKNPVKVSNLVFTNLENLSDTVYYSYEFEATEALQNVADMKIFKLPWADGIRSVSVVALDERKYPFEFWYYLYSDGEYEQVTFLLPKEKQWIETPRNVHLECAAAVYDMTFDTSIAGEIVVTRTFKKKKDYVLPEEYVDFKKFIHAVSSNDDKQYVVK